MFRAFITYLGILSLILSLVLPSSLNLSLYHWQGSKIRQEVKAYFKAGLKDSELSTFTFSEIEYRALDWENEHEFIWNNSKYDIVSIVYQGPKIIVKAWLDDKESALRKRFHELLETHQPPPASSDTFKLIDFFKGFFSPLITWQFEQENPKFDSFPYWEFLPLVFGQTPCPPPQL